jgi:protocatechuate 3,4-dioxygenase beta subunit
MYFVNMSELEQQMLRRKFISGVGWLAAGSAMPFVNARAELATPSQSCRATLRQSEGPYLTPDSPNRSDISEGCPGTPLHLTLNILDDYWCTPIEDATVNIWHCDANGLYSGVRNDEIDLETLRITDKSVDMTDRTFLRGQQTSDGTGKVEFTTIFPGWYSGRLSHIHLQTIIQNLHWTSHITQLYLPIDVEREVYLTEPYKNRGQNPIKIDRDLVARGDSAAVEQLTLPLVRDGDGFRGHFDLAVTF